ncbi:hypothetical protein Lesp02_18550 [Lentzea sp. NBRC 105346]|uniref:hypothetical protein n=1 Tax=Lentzea sp. NBRC 105346 TaxID=3032205 RepID=UPI0024A2DCBD|nr:hypothetical protein [Lentzea sp. NBRC 105346]GLZ29665.1 hypothetical protein Lesp02_18550 [Lentzea sp. NBRC 105346]
MRILVTLTGLMAALLVAPQAHAAGPPPGETGWKKQNFTYKIHSPYDRPVSDRYTFSGGVHTMKILKTDKPFEPGSKTSPRTEMRWLQEYTTGEHLWSADVWIKSGTNGSSIAQILRVKHPSGTPATDIMLFAHNQNGGTLKRYNGEVVKTGVYDKWFSLKIAHNAKTGKIRVFADEKLALTVNDRGPATRHFKNGVYGTSGSSEARFRNVEYWTR